MTGWFGSPDNAVVTTPVTVIGYDGSSLSDESLSFLAEADLVVGGERHLAAVPVPASAETIVLGTLGPALERVRTAHREGQRVVVVASGDPGLFGIVRALRSWVSDMVPVRVLPGVSSVSLAAARLGFAWDDAFVVSAHGRDPRPALNVLRRHGHSQRRVVVLTSPDCTPGDLVAGLGADCPDLFVLEHLGAPEERITRISENPGPGDVSHELAITHRWESPNVVVTSARGANSTPVWLLGHRDGHGQFAGQWALPDEEFAHRDGMLTKRDVRACVLSRLAPGPGTLVWDVGSGSGSVAVECARLGSAAVAIERDAAALELIAANENDHQVNVRVVLGKAPDALVGLPHPDAVFVGGGGPEVVAAVAAVRPERVVVALATLERVTPTIAALEDYEVETVLLQVSKLEPLGEGHRLVPANPVFIVSGVLP